MQYQLNRKSLNDAKFGASYIEMCAFTHCMWEKKKQARVWFILELLVLVLWLNLSFFKYSPLHIYNFNLFFHNGGRFGRRPKNYSLCRHCKWQFGMLYMSESFHWPSHISLWVSFMDNHYFNVTSYWFISIIVILFANIVYSKQ